MRFSNSVLVGKATRPFTQLIVDDMTFDGSNDHGGWYGVNPTWWPNPLPLFTDFSSLRTFCATYKFSPDEAQFKYWRPQVCKSPFGHIYQDSKCVFCDHPEK